MSKSTPTNTSTTPAHSLNASASLSTRTDRRATTTVEAPVDLRYLVDRISPARRATLKRRLALVQQRGQL